MSRAVVGALLCVAASARAQWASTGSVATARASFTTSVLFDGRVFVTGGYAPVTATTELFDPATGQWSAGPELPVFRFFHSATVLADGGVLVVGGDFGTLLADVNRYNPASNDFTALAPLDAGRAQHAAIRLRDGTVLIAGGRLMTGATNTCVLFDPTTGAWRSTGSFTRPRYSAAIVLLQDGRVLLVGGRDATSFFGDADVYDPVSGTWSPAPTLQVARESHSALLLDDGSVLVVGNLPHDPGTSERWAPGGSGWQPQPMTIQHFAPFTAVLDGGRVIAGGGYAGDAGSLTLTELFDPPSNRWFPLTNLNAPSYYGGTAMLRDGRVLAIAGQDDVGIVTRSELFTAMPFDAGFDGGLPDAGPGDAGVEDAGAPDAGAPDAGTPDAGMTDAGALDAGGGDAGSSSDAGVTPADAGVSERALQVGCGCSANAAELIVALVLLLARRRAQLSARLG